MNDWIYLLGVALGALGLAYISLVEAAMVSVSRVRLHQLAEDGHRGAAIAEEMTAHPQELLGGLVVAINVLVLLCANLTTAFAVRNWGSGSVLWANLVVLLFLLIFCEITPKTVAVHYAEGITLRAAPTVAFINMLLTPVVVVLSAIAHVLLRVLIALHVLRGRVDAVPTAFSEEDIKQLLAAGEQSGQVEASEREMIHGVIEFADTSAYEIMVPRTDLLALEDDTSLEEAITAFMASGHSRIPVYHENADNILGLLYIKDVMVRLHEAERTGAPPPPITGMLRPAYFVPESKKSDELLRELQRRQVHLAIVVDEYGGTAGLITIEDLLEEIVGDIIDEYDQESDEVTLLPNGEALVEGRASLEKIHDVFDIPIPEETEAETIGGLLTEILGRIPDVGDHAVVEGVEFTIIEVAHNRVQRLRAVVLPEGALGEE